MPTGLAAYDPNRIINSLPTVDDSMANQVTALSSKDSALNQMAKTEGLKAANRRGLLNSSMAVGASQDAVLKNILPIAGQDAQTAANKNAAARAFEYGLTAQEQQQGWQTGEREAGQQFTTGERVASQAFVSTQADLDRLLQTKLQANQIDAARANLITQIASTEGMEAANRELQKFLQESQQTWGTGERIATQQFTGTQADLDRMLQTRLQQGQIDATRANLISQIASTEGMEAANRELQKFLQESGQTWQTGERVATQAFTGTQADLDRMLQTRLQQGQIDATRANLISQIASTEGMEAANRELQAYLQESGQMWQTGERMGTQEWQTAEGAAGRAWSTGERIGTEAYTAEQNNLNRALETQLQAGRITSAEAMQYRDIASREGMNAANNALQWNMFSKDIDFRVSEGALDRASAAKLQADAQAFQSTQNQLTRDLENKIAGMNLSATQQAGLMGAVSNANLAYQAQYQTIMANPDLDAGTRAQYMAAAKSHFDNYIGAAQTLYNIDVRWNGPAPAAAPVPAAAAYTPPPAPAPAYVAPAPAYVAPAPAPAPAYRAPTATAPLPSYTTNPSTTVPTSGFRAPIVSSVRSNSR